MLANAAMKPGRFRRWNDARRKLGATRAHLASGGTVIVATHTKAMYYDGKSKKSWQFPAMFRADRGGLYVSRGKSWDCIDYCGVILRSDSGDLNLNAFDHSRYE